MHRGNLLKSSAFADEVKAAELDAQVERLLGAVSRHGRRYYVYLATPNPDGMAAFGRWIVETFTRLPARGGPG